MNGFVVDIKKAQDFFVWAVTTFTGKSRISFEGSFPEAEFLSIPGASTAKDAILVKHTAQPRSSFVIFPLDEQSAGIIVRSVLPRIGLRHSVHHIQIEKDDVVVLATYDNLNDCWLAPTVEESELAKLKSRGVVRSFTKARE